MTDARSKPEIDARFLDSEGGSLFTLCLRPSSPGKQALVFCPPFAEEMNKSRRMMTEAGQQLAQAGVTVVILDLYGTGDSDGDFGDARWETWQQNIESAMEWLSRDGDYEVTLCGIRLGAALSLAVAERMPSRIKKVLLWQPVISGSTFMTQFLRLKLAAQLNSAERTGTQELREQALGGGHLEIAGYAVAPELFKAIDEIDLRKSRPPSELAVHWLEVVAASRPRMAPLSQRAIAGWRDQGIEITEGCVVGEPFWATAELSMAPALIEETVAICG